MAKPAVPVARAGDYTVRKIRHAVGAAYIRKHHYARKCSNTAVYMFGLYTKTNQLVGAAQFIPPTSTAAKTVSGDWKSVLCLSRFVVGNWLPNNTESLFLGACIRELKKQNKWRMLLTYADSAYGHSGTIYRATNWEYLGVTAPTVRYQTVSGAQVAKKSTRNRTKAEMAELGAFRVPASIKHKYIFRLG